MLKKLTLKAGVNRENTRYTNENGFYVSDKVRFRQGTPEKIGGWTRISATFFLGVCRSLWNWITLGGANLLGIGTNLKFYIEQGGSYSDITPLRQTITLGANPFTTVNLSTTVTVTDSTGGWVNGDYVTFSGATAVGGLTISGEYQLTATGVSTTTYTIQSATAATSSATGGGSSVVAAYQINVGPATAVPIVGWGAGGWGLGTWGVGASSAYPIRLWSQMNFGDNLIFGPRSGPIYYWVNSSGLTSRGVLLSSTGGSVTFTNASPTVVTATTTFTDGTTLQFAATSSLPTGVSAATTYYVSNVSGYTFKLTDSAGTLINTSSTGSGVYISSIVDVPVIQNYLLVSDASRFIFAFGCNDYGSSTQNPMLLRWSDQENPIQWTPAATNQAGSLLLSHGSQIITALQARQEILVFTDSTLYSLQYQGPPVVWGSQLLADNISIAGQNAVALASGATYWMGVDKFYKYDGRVQTLRCDLRQYIYNNINLDQASQFFASTNEGFNEVWFFYCSAASSTIDRYVVYNYFENNGEGVWYYGDMVRTAWLDSGLRNYPMAATGINNIVYHELGVDDNATATTTAINAIIETAEFDIDDGDSFGFVRRILPDITFSGSNGTNTPQVTMTLIPMQNSGSGANNPQSVGGESYASIQRIATAPIEEFTGQVYIRVRGRQMILKIESNQIGTQWQLGSPRLDIRADGRRGNS
jgi:hypothetical protein